MIKQLKIKNFILFLILSILFTACKFQDVEIGDIQSVEFNKISNEKILINILLPVKNPNNYKIKIKNHDIQIDINGYNFDIVDEDKKIVIPEKFDGIIIVPIRMSNKEIISFKTMKAIYDIMSTKKLHLKAYGYANVKVLIVTKKISIDEKRTINL